MAVSLPASPELFNYPFESSPNFRVLTGIVSGTTSTKQGGWLPLTSPSAQMLVNVGDTGGVAIDLPTTFDFASASNPTIVWAWQFNAPNRMQVAANGFKFRLYSGTGTTNYREFTVAGNNTEAAASQAGAQAFCIDPRATSYVEVGTFDESNVTAYGPSVTGFGMQGGASSQTFYTRLYLFDAVLDGDMPTFTGTSDFDDLILTVLGTDYTNKTHAFVQQAGSVYSVQSPFQIGDGVTNTDFTLPATATVLSPSTNDPKDPRFHLSPASMQVFANLTAASTVSLLGTCTWGTAANWNFGTAVGADVQLSGTFSGMGDMFLNSDCELSGTFTSVETVHADGSLLSLPTISQSNGVIINPSTTGTASVTNCVEGIIIEDNTTHTYDVSGFTVSGNTADVTVKSTSGTITIKTNGLPFNVVDAGGGATVIVDSTVDVQFNIAPSGGTLSFLNTDKWNNFLGVYVSDAAAQADNPTPASGDYYAVDANSDQTRESHGYWDGSQWVIELISSLAEYTIISTDLGGVGANPTEFLSLDVGSNWRWFYDAKGYTPKLGDFTVVGGILPIQIDLVVNTSFDGIPQSKFDDALLLVAQSQVLPADDQSVMTGLIPNVSATDIQLGLAFVELMRLIAESAEGALVSNDSTLFEVSEGRVIAKDDTFRVLPLDTYPTGTAVDFAPYVELQNYTIEFAPFDVNNNRVCYTAVPTTQVVGASIIGTTDANVVSLDQAALAQFVTDDTGETAAAAGSVAELSKGSGGDTDVNVISVAGVGVAGVDDFKADLSLVALETTSQEILGAVESIAAGGASQNKPASASVINAGLSAGGSLSNTKTLDGLFESFTDDAGTLDVDYTFNVGSVGTASIVRFDISVVGNNDSITVSVYNYVDAQFQQLNVIAGGSQVNVQSFISELTVENTDENGDAIIKFSGTGLTSAQLDVDRILIGFSVFNDSAGYEAGAVWSSNSSTNTGTAPRIDGTVDNKVDSLATARIIADNPVLNLRSFRVDYNDSIILDQSYIGYEVQGSLYLLDLNGQISPSKIIGGLLHGIQAAGSQYIYERCRLGLNDFTPLTINGGGGVGECTIVNVILGSPNLLMTAGAVTTGTPTVGLTESVFDFNNQGSATINLTDFNGDLVVKRMSATDKLNVNGSGKITFDVTCTGGTVAIAGPISPTDLSSNVTFVGDGQLTTDILTVKSDLDALQQESDALTRYDALVAEHDATQIAISSLNDFDPATDIVANVSTVQTTVSNSDMRGTDNALLSSDPRLDNLDATISSRSTQASVDAVPTVTEIDTELTASHGSGSWQQGSSGTVDANIISVSGNPVTSTNDFKADVSGLSTFDPALDTVLNVDTVQTTVSNTDMRGTDGANTIAPDNAGIAAIPTNPLLTDDPRLDNLDAPISGAGLDQPTFDTRMANVPTATKETYQADVSDRASQASIDALNDISPAEVKAEVDQALVDADVATETNVNTKASQTSVDAVPVGTKNEILGTTSFP